MGTQWLTRARIDRLAQKYEVLKQNKAELERRHRQPPQHHDGPPQPQRARPPQLELYTRVVLAGVGRVSHHAARDSSLLFSCGALIGRVSLLVGANPNTVSWFAVHERSSTVRDVCSRARDDLMLSCDSTSEVAVWDLSSGNVVHRVMRAAVTAVAWDATDPYRFYCAQRNQVHSFDLRRLGDVAPAAPWTLPHPHPIQRLIVAQQQLWASSLGGVCAAGAAAPLVDGTVYSMAADGDRLMCSFRDAAVHAPAVHTAFARDAAGKWTAGASIAARWPNVLLSRTSVAGQLFAAGDGDAVRVWQLDGGGGASVVEALLSGGAATDANIFVERSSRQTFLCAVTQCDMNLWRVIAGDAQ